MENRDAGETNLAEILLGRFIAFTAGGSRYAIHLKYVSDLLEVDSVIKIEGLQESLIGVAFFGDALIPVMDLRTYLQKTPQAESDTTSVLVLEYEGLFSAVIVDSVTILLPTTAEGIHRLPCNQTEGHCLPVTDVYQIGSANVSLIDCGMLFSA